MNNKRLGIYFYLLLCPFFLIASEIDDYFELIKNRNYMRASNYVDLLENYPHKSSLHYLTYLLANEEKGVFSFDHTLERDLESLFIKRLIVGYEYFFDVSPSHLDAYKNFSEALKISRQIGNKNLSKAALIALLDLYSNEIFIGSKQYEPVLEQFNELKSDIADEALILMYSLVFYSKASDSKDVDAQYFNYIGTLDSIFKILPKNHPFFPRYYFEKGIQYKLDNPEKSISFFIKADSLAVKGNLTNGFRGAVAWQLSQVYLWNENLAKSMKYLEISNNFSRKLKEIFYYDRLKSLIFEKDGKYDSAYHYLRKSVDIEYQLGYKNNTLESAILTVQNQTDKLKLDKFELDAQNKKIKIWTLGLGLALLFGSVIGVLTYKNTKRKQLLAEQGKILEQQKVATLLKDQELATIDAMIEGQEKERQRIAHDLHDDLGGLMANVKLHFNSLQEKAISNKQELYSKTNELLEEAYQKIRAIAHEKNSGVIAKQGLLRAVNQMADKISQSNKIAVTVQDFGLDNRLENSLELNLFRIIQELMTNIIKHSKATTANIHLTNHGDLLNILVEDNGIGFDPKTLKKGKDGMGLKSIDKRISHLEGTFHIESEPGKGSTIIIDIPI